MQTMKERIARRLLLDGGLSKHVIAAMRLHSDVHWSDALKTADAVLEELREPTEGVIEAGQKVSLNARAQTVWVTMIDHARREEE